MTDETQRIAGLTRDEWVHVAQIVMRWPRLGVCEPWFAQMVVERVNGCLARLEGQHP